MIEVGFAISVSVLAVTSIVLASKAIYEIHVTDKLYKLAEERRELETELDSDYNRYIDLFSGEK